MEKPARASKGRIFSFLPKTATVSFQNPPFSPGRDKRIAENSAKFFKPSYNGHKSFSGPIISIIPVEARTKSKNGGFDSQEPTSPKVSCIGQIKHKNKICKAKRVIPKSQTAQNQFEKKPKQKLKQPSSDSTEKIAKRSSSSIRNIFRSAMSGRKSSNCSKVQGNRDDRATLEANRAPALGQMKRFASGRSGLADFDWRDFAGDRKYHSDEENEQSDEEEEEERIIVPHSAPLMVGEGRVALEPRKEISLWKRRTVAPIRPLELN